MLFFLIDAKIQIRIFLAMEWAEIVAMMGAKIEVKVEVVKSDFSSVFYG